MIDPKMLDELNNKISSLIANSPAKDIERNAKAALSGLFNKLDLVTREEFEQSMRLWGIRLESLNKTARNKCSMALGSVWDESGEDIDELIKRADALMYENKKLMKAGRGE